MTDLPALLQANFTAANAVRSSNTYTIYEITMQSVVAPSWVLLKRYSSFANFHRNLKREIHNNPALSELQIQALPPLPPKQIWGRFTGETVAKRQKMFQVYVQFLLTNRTLMCHSLVMDFLNVPQGIRQILENQQMALNEKVPKNPNKTITLSEMANISSEEKVNELLNDLTDERNSTAALINFQRWYFEYLPNMKAKLIHRLLMGEPKPKKGRVLKGVIPSCKFVSSASKLTWLSAMSLLLKLLDIERNKYARLIHVVFFRLDVKYYALLDLHRHIKDNTKEDAFYIMQLLRDNAKHLKVEYYCSDVEALMQFEKWFKLKNESYSVGEINLVSQDQFGQRNRWFDWAANNADFEAMGEEIFKQYRFFANESDDDYQFLPRLHDRYGHHLNVRHKKDFYSDHWKIKVSFTVQQRPEDVYKFLLNVRQPWNKKLISSKIIEKLKPNYSISHDIYKSFNSAYKFHDFVLLRVIAPKSKKNDGYLILHASITNFHKIPQSKDRLRSIILPSGFEIIKSGNNPKRSEVSYRLHMTPEAVSIVSADLLGESEELFQSMVRIARLTSLMIQNEFRQKLLQNNNDEHINNGTNNKQMNGNANF